MRDHRSRRFLAGMGDGVLFSPAQVATMTDPDRLTRFFKSAGRQYEEARRAYGGGKQSVLEDLPTDDKGRAQIVCRRFAERRAAPLDDEARPACFDSDHPDCQGCLEDIRSGQIETWE